MTDDTMGSSTYGSRLSTIMRAAWKAHRLDVIRDVVERTIRDLRARNPRDVMGRSLTWSEELTSGPISAALDACCDELRDGCGLPPQSGSGGDHETRPVGPSASWTDHYVLALARYRETASAALEMSFQSLTLGGSGKAAAH